MTGPFQATGPDAPIGVVVVDDHPLIRAGLRAVIGDAAGVELLAEGTSGAAAVELAATHHPKVVLLDVRMPLPDGSAGLNGIEATRRIVAADPDVAVLMLTMVDDDAAVVAALRAGARGYLLKESSPAEIVAAVRAVAQGVTVLGAALTERVVAGRVTDRSSDRVERSLPGLTARERDVLAELADGAGNAAIAHRLGLTEKTVRNNVSTILAKLGVSDRVHAGAAARAAGLSVPAR